METITNIMYPAFAVFERILAKKMLLILSIPVLALTARADSVVVDTLQQGTYELSFAYDLGNFAQAAEIAAPFIAQASGNLATIDLGLTFYDYPYIGIASAYLYGDDTGQGYPHYPDNANQIFLGLVTPTAQFQLTTTSVVSISVTGTVPVVPVTAGTTYWLVLKGEAPPHHYTNTCDGTFHCVHDMWHVALPHVYDPAAGFSGFSSFDDVIWINNQSPLPAFRITAVIPYSAQIQPPINADGSSIFNSRRGVVAVRFTLTYGGVATCDLPPATIAVTRTAGGVTASVNESVYTASADTGSNFRISGCQYTYNLDSRSLGAGVYRVDILINGSAVGSTTFELR